ncbi:MAG: outer membrane beta-barrel protein [Eikenella corrodens]
MQKTLIALAVLALSAVVQAAPADEGVPLHPINDGRYTVTVGYAHENAEIDQLKYSGDGVTLQGRADIPLTQQHAIRAELGYRYLDSDAKANGEKVINGAKTNNVDVYAGYLFSPSGFKNGGLRVGGGLGYSHGKMDLHSHQTDLDGDAVDISANNLYLKAQVEYEQQLGSGWSITPWTEAQVSLHRRVEEKYTQIEFASDGRYKQNNYSLGLGVDVNKQLGESTSLTFGPYYRYTRDKATSFTHEDENIEVPKTSRHSFGIRGGVRF